MKTTEQTTEQLTTLETLRRKEIQINDQSRIALVRTLVPILHQLGEVTIGATTFRETRNWCYGEDKNSWAVEKSEQVKRGCVTMSLPPVRIYDIAELEALLAFVQVEKLIEKEIEKRTLAVSAASNRLNEIKTLCATFPSVT